MSAARRLPISILDQAASMLDYDVREVRRSDFRILVEELLGSPLK